MTAASASSVRLVLPRILTIALLTSSLLPSVLQAQQPLTTGLPITAAPADPAIAAALAQVSPDHIKATITKLVSFNNRSTLSSMDTDLAPNTGVTRADACFY